MNAEDFKEYLNENNIERSTPTRIFVKTEEQGKCKSSILIRNEANYREQINIEFAIKFQYTKYEEEENFQRMFTIEHHHEAKSTHTDPHLQIKIHGPKGNDKIGQLHIILNLNKDNEDEEYETCIRGFIYKLEEIISITKEGLDKELLNTIKIQELQYEKQFLMSKIEDSLKTKGITLKFPNKTQQTISKEQITQLMKQDKTLQPLLMLK